MVKRVTQEAVLELVSGSIFFKQTECLWLGCKPRFGLGPGAFEKITLPVYFQVSFAVPMAVGVVDIGVSGIATKFQMLHPWKISDQVSDSAEVGEEIIHMILLKFHSYNSCNHRGLG